VDAIHGHLSNDKVVRLRPIMHAKGSSRRSVRTGRSNAETSTAPAGPSPNLAILVGGARTASDRLMPACGGIFQAQKSQVSLGARVTWRGRDLRLRVIIVQTAQLGSRAA